MLYSLIKKVLLGVSILAIQPVHAISPVRVASIATGTVTVAFGSFLAFCRLCDPSLETFVYIANKTIDVASYALPASIIAGGGALIYYGLNESNNGDSTENNLS